MKNVTKGMVAWSRAGHDSGKLYVIIDLDEQFAYLADGRLKRVESPKKKKWKHIQVRKEVPEEFRELDWDSVKNEDVKRVIKLIKKESQEV